MYIHIYIYMYIHIYIYIYIYEMKRYKSCTKCINNTVVRDSCSCAPFCSQFNRIQIIYRVIDKADRNGSIGQAYVTLFQNITIMSFNINYYD